jgi:hypothetical protein
MTFYGGLGHTGSLSDREMKFLASKPGFMAGGSNPDNQVKLRTDHVSTAPLDPTKVP